MARTSLQRLGQQLRKRRAGRGIRDVAKEIRISAATLSRVERGNLPDLETFAKICEWMKTDPAKVLGIDVERTSGTETTALITATAHFRADQTTSPRLADALAKMIIAADQMLKTEPPPDGGQT